MPINDPNEIWSNASSYGDAAVADQALSDANANTDNSITKNIITQTEHGAFKDFSSNQRNRSITTMTNDPNNPYVFKDRYEALVDSGLYDPTGRLNEQRFQETQGTWGELKRASGAWMSNMYAAFIDTLPIAANLWNEGGYGSSKWTADMMTKAAVVGRASDNSGELYSFLLDTFVSSGYTLGIVFESAMEQAILARFGLLSLPEKAAKIKNYTNVERAIQNQKNLEKALTQIPRSSTLDQVKQGFKNFFNPFENTVDAVRDIKKMREIDQATNLLETGGKRLAGGLWLDFSAIKMAWSEGNVEAETAKTDFKYQQEQSFYERHGRSMTEEEKKKMDDFANNTQNYVRLSNLALLYTTNKITLGFMTRPLKNLPSPFVGSTGYGFAVSKTVKNGVKIRSVKPITSFGQNLLAKTKGSITSPRLWAKATGLYALENVTEGIEEISQDAISSAAKNTFDSEFRNELYGDKIRGGYLSFLYQGFKNQMNKEGLKTFMSGFIMQTMAHPVQSAVMNTVNIMKEGSAIDPYGETLSSKIGGFIHDTGKYAMNLRHLDKARDAKEERKKQQQKNKESRDKEVEEINKALELFPELYLSGEFEAASIIQKLAGTVKNDMDDDEKKKIIDTAMTKYGTLLLKNGMYDVAMDTLRDMKKMSKDELNDLYNSTIAGMGTNLNDNIDNLITKLQKQKVAYDDFTAQYKKPWSNEHINSLRNSGRMDELYAAVMENKAYEDIVASYVFHNDKMIEAQEIQKQLYDDFERLETENPNIDAKNMSAGGLTILTSQSSIATRLSFLKDTIRQYSQLTNPDAETQRLLDGAKKEYDILKRVYDSYIGFQKAMKSGKDEERQKAQKEKEDAIIAYIDSISTGIFSRQDKVKIKDVLMKYIEASSDKDISMENLYYFANKDYFQYVLRGITGYYEKLWNNRKEDINKAMTAMSNWTKNEELISDLRKNGFAIDEEDLKRIEEGKAPRAIYDIGKERSKIKDKTADKLSPTSNRYREAIELINSYYKLNEIRISDEEFEDDNSSQNDKLTLDSLMKQLGVELNGTYSLSEVIQKIIDRNFNTNEHVSTEDEEIILNELLMLKESGALDDLNIKFTNMPVPIRIDQSNTIMIDPRFFSREYSSNTKRYNDIANYLYSAVCNIYVHNNLENVINKLKEKNVDIEYIKQTVVDNMKQMQATERANPDNSSFPLKITDKEIEQINNMSIQEFIKDFLLSRRMRVFANVGYETNILNDIDEGLQIDGVGVVSFVAERPENYTDDSDAQFDNSVAIIGQRYTDSNMSNAFNVYKALLRICDNLFENKVYSKSARTSGTREINEVINENDTEDGIINKMTNEEIDDLMYDFYLYLEEQSENEALTDDMRRQFASSYFLNHYKKVVRNEIEIIVDNDNERDIDREEAKKIIRLNIVNFRNYKNHDNYKSLINNHNVKAETISNAEFDITRPIQKVPVTKMEKEAFEKYKTVTRKRVVLLAGKINYYGTNVLSDIEKQMYEQKKEEVDNLVEDYKVIRSKANVFPYQNGSRKNYVKSEDEMIQYLVKKGFNEQELKRHRELIRILYVNDLSLLDFQELQDSKIVKDYDFAKMTEKNMLTQIESLDKITKTTINNFNGILDSIENEFLDKQKINDALLDKQERLRKGKNKKDYIQGDVVKIEENNYICVEKYLENNEMVYVFMRSSKIQQQGTSRISYGREGVLYASENDVFGDVDNYIKITESVMNTLDITKESLSVANDLLNREEIIKPLLINLMPVIVNIDKKNPLKESYDNEDIFSDRFNC